MTDRPLGENEHHITLTRAALKKLLRGGIIRFPDITLVGPQLQRCEFCFFGIMIRGLCTRCDGKAGIAKPGATVCEHMNEPLECPQCRQRRADDTK